MGNFQHQLLTEFQKLDVKALSVLDSLTAGRIPLESLQGQINGTWVRAKPSQAPPTLYLPAQGGAQVLEKLKGFEKFARLLFL